MTTDAYLEHYGIKGMHWGQRKAANAARASIPRQAGYSDGAHAVDKKKFGQKGTDRINQNMSKGMGYSDARKAEVSRRRKRNTLIAGSYLAARALYVYGPSLLQAGAQSYVGGKQETAGKKAAANLFSDSRGIGNQKIVDLGFDKDTGTWG